MFCLAGINLQSTAQATARLVTLGYSCKERLLLDALNTNLLSDSAWLPAKVNRWLVYLVAVRLIFRRGSTSISSPTGDKRT